MKRQRTQPHALLLLLLLLLLSLLLLCFTDFIVRVNKRFLFLLLRQQTAKSTYVLTRNRSANQRKKYRAVTFYFIGDFMHEFSSFARKKKN